MLTVAWFWICALSFTAGIGVVSRGFYLMRRDRDSRLGLRFVSFGSAIVVVGLAATFLQL